MQPLVFWLKAITNRIKFNLENYKEGPPASQAFLSMYEPMLNGCLSPRILSVSLLLYG